MAREKKRERRGKKKKKGRACMRQRETQKRLPSLATSIFFTFLSVENNKIKDRLVNCTTPHIELHCLQIYHNASLDLG
jgi:hypothetical protein